MVRFFLLVIAQGIILLSVFTVWRPRDPAPELIQLAVRATLHAIPTATPHVVEVTRVVEVTPTPSATATETPLPAATKTPEATATVTAVSEESVRVPEAQAASVAAETLRVDASLAAPPVEDPPAEQEVSVTAGCHAVSDRTYSLIPVSGGSIDHPDVQHGDLNLSLRGYAPAGAAAALVTINGPTGADPPQLSAMLPGRSPQPVSTYRVNRWDWRCGDHGCRGSEPVRAEVSLLGLAAEPGIPVSIPSRRAEIYGGGYLALVLYAEESRITLVYTRENSVANGYAVHIERFCVDPALVNAYRSANAAGRGSLPAIRNGEIVGVASGNEVAVAIRDRGAFLDPRSRKDWWQ